MGLYTVLVQGDMATTCVPSPSRQIDLPGQLARQSRGVTMRPMHGLRRPGGLTSDFQHRFLTFDSMRQSCLPHVPHLFYFIFCTARVHVDVNVHIFNANGRGHSFFQPNFRAKYLGVYTAFEILLIDTIYWSAWILGVYRVSPTCAAPHPLSLGLI